MEAPLKVDQMNAGAAEGKVIRERRLLDWAVRNEKSKQNRTKDGPLWDASAADSPAGSGALPSDAGLPTAKKSGHPVKEIWMEIGQSYVVEEERMIDAFERLADVNGVCGGLERRLFLVEACSDAMDEWEKRGGR